jgi:hypothetical protein
MNDENPQHAPMPTEGAGQLVLYRTEDRRNRISCRLGDDSVWLTQLAMADLFQTTPQNITLHIGAIDQEGEPSETPTCKEYLQVREEGPRYPGQDGFRQSDTMLQPLRTSRECRSTEFKRGFLSSPSRLIADLRIP